MFSVSNDFWPVEGFFYAFAFRPGGRGTGRLMIAENIKYDNNE